MSKVGKKPITIPKGIEVKLEGASISVKGPKGSLARDIPSQVSVAVEGDQIMVTPSVDTRPARERWGLFRALIQNMVTGVNTGFEKVLEFQGVGYKASVNGKNLELGLGFSHPITIEGPEGISFQTEKSTIKVQGIDKELVGEVAANIRSLRLPEPYKGSGIHYQGEVIRRKAGKKAATAA